MAFDVPTIVAADNAGNDTDYDAWVKARDLIRAANAGQLQGFKNKLMNGAFEIWQRGTSGFTSGYAADRWTLINTTSGARSTDVPAGARYSIEFANSSASFPLIAQRIEAANAAELVGRAVRVSFWAKNVSGAASLFVELDYANAADNFGAITLVQVVVVSASPSASWTLYEADFSALPAGVANGLEVRIVRGNGAAATTRVALVQLEAVDASTPKASPFEYRPVGLELALCQRYYEKSYPLGTAIGVDVKDLARGTQAGHPSANCGITAPFAVRKRAAPTFTTYDAAGNAGKITYFNGAWVDNGTPSTAIATEAQAYVAHFIASAIITAFGWTASAEL